MVIGASSGMGAGTGSVAFFCGLVLLMVTGSCKTESASSLMRSSSSAFKASSSNVSMEMEDERVCVMSLTSVLASCMSAMTSSTEESVASSPNVFMALEVSFMEERTCWFNCVVAMQSSCCSRASLLRVVRDRLFRFEALVMRSCLTLLTAFACWACLTLTATSLRAVLRLCSLCLSSSMVSESFISAERMVSIWLGLRKAPRSDQ